MIGSWDNGMKVQEVTGLSVKVSADCKYCTYSVHAQDEIKTPPDCISIN